MSRNRADRIYARLLRQPCAFHLQTSTAELSARLLANVNRVAVQVVTPSLQLLSAVASIVLLSLGVLLVGRWLAVALVLGLVAAYGLVSTAVTPQLRLASRQRLRMEGRSTAVLLDAIGSIRDIQLSGSEPFFEQQFGVTTEQSRHSIWIAEWLPELPRGLIEPFGITMIFAIGALPALLSGNPQQVQAILPFLATISVAALRLTPPLQDAFRSVTRVRGGLPLLADLLELLQLPQDRPTLASPGVPSPAGVFPRQMLRLRDVWFRYPQSDDWVLKGVSLTIPLGSRVALVGANRQWQDHHRSSSAWLAHGRQRRPGTRWHPRGGPRSAGLAGQLRPRASDHQFAQCQRSGERRFRAVAGAGRSASGLGGAGGGPAA